MITPFLHIHHCPRARTTERIEERQPQFNIVVYGLSEGEKRYEVGGCRYSVGKGDLILIRRGESHSFQTVGHSETCMIAFKDEFLGKADLERVFRLDLLEVFREPRLLHLDQRPSYRIQAESFLRRMLNEQRTDPVALVRLRNNLFELLVLIEEFRDRSAGSNDERETALDLILKFAAENYFDDISLQDACRSLKLRYGPVCRLFKDRMGRSFTQHVNQLRLARCAELLKEPSRSILSLCFEVGFQDLAHFNRTFKRQYGLSPTAYRKKLLQPAAR